MPDIFLYKIQETYHGAAARFLLTVGKQVVVILAS